MKVLDGEFTTPLPSQRPHRLPQQPHRRFASDNRAIRLSLEWLSVHPLPLPPPPPRINPPHARTNARTSF